jgi:hypothetical protein
MVFMNQSVTFDDYKCATMNKLKTYEDYKCGM